MPPHEMAPYRAVRKIEHREKHPSSFSVRNVSSFAFNASRKARCERRTPRIHVREHAIARAEPMVNDPRPSPTLDPLSVAHRLYEAFCQGDGAALSALLHPEFTGHVSDGMPMGVGGAVPDRPHMLRVWGTIAAHYDVRPVPEEFIRADASRIVVLGHYLGSGPRAGGGGPIRSAFAHILDIRDNAIVSLKQITDTVCWSAQMPNPQHADVQYGR